jgi:mycoredoxin
MPRNNPLPNRPAPSGGRKRVDVYGTSWCAASQSVRRLLDRLSVYYVYYDLEKDAQATQRVRWWSGGHPSHPTVQLGGEILIEPTLDELQLALARHDLI